MNHLTNLCPTRLSSVVNFSAWERCKAAKRKDGRINIEVRDNGKVTFHVGYVTAKESRRLESGEANDTGPKVPRPEISGTMQTYIDLHRHAAVREALTGHPKVALRLMEIGRAHV